MKCFNLRAREKKERGGKKTRRKEGEDLFPPFSPPVMGGGAFAFDACDKALCG